VANTNTIKFKVKKCLWHCSHFTVNSRNEDRKSLTNAKGMCDSDACMKAHCEPIRSARHRVDIQHDDDNGN